MKVDASRVRIVSVLALLAFAGPGARAQSYSAHLTGPPANNSPGIGDATFSLVGNMFSVSVSFSGLTAGTTASHVHCCTTNPLTGDAGVATQVPSFPGFPLGVTSGTYSRTFDLSLPSSYNPAFVTAHGGVAGAKTAFIDGLNGGNAYLNIHTTAFPGGEIRGFIIATP